MFKSLKNHNCFTQIFNLICKSKDELLEFFFIICGDISLDGLDLSSEDEATLIHEPIKDAVNVNVTGTLRVLQLSFSYMSTAYCHCNQIELKEIYYPSNVDVFELITQTKSFDATNLFELEKELLDTKSSQISTKY